MYKVGTGELSPVKAIHYVIDRATSVVGHIAKQVCTRAGRILGRIAGTTVGELIEKKFKVKGFSKYSKYVGEIAGEKVGKTISGYIKKGAKIVGEGSKKIVTSIAKGIETGWNALKSGVKSFLGL